MGERVGHSRVGEEQRRWNASGGGLPTEYGLGELVAYLFAVDTVDTPVLGRVKFMAHLGSV